MSPGHTDAAEGRDRKEPLSGIGVLVTRDARQASDLSDRLRALGANVFEFPVIEIRSPTSFAEIDGAIQILNEYDWVVFASTNAVEFFLNRVLTQDSALAQLQSRSIAAVGGQTAEALSKYDLTVSFLPKKFSAESFVQDFCAEHQTKNKRFLWPRTNVGEPLIKQRLEEKGGRVDVVIAYETCLPAQAEVAAAELVKLVDCGQLQFVTLTSSQSAKNLHQLLGSKPKHGLTGITIATIGTETTKTVSQLFDCKLIQSDRFTISGIIDSIKSFVLSEK